MEVGCEIQEAFGSPKKTIPSLKKIRGCRRIYCVDGAAGGGGRREKKRKARGRGPGFETQLHKPDHWAGGRKSWTRKQRRRDLGRVGGPKESKAVSGGARDDIQRTV